jgi:hypothetical protein
VRDIHVRSVGAKQWSIQAFQARFTHSLPATLHIDWTVDIIAMWIIT